MYPISSNTQKVLYSPSTRSVSFTGNDKKLAPTDEPSIKRDYKNVISGIGITALAIGATYLTHRIKREALPSFLYPVKDLVDKAARGLVGLVKAKK